MGKNDKFSTKCGCSFVPGEKGELCIEYCPLHFAAPDLLRVCENWLIGLKANMTKREKQLIAQTKAAIAKAKP